MAGQIVQAEREAIMDINTTPLIDVMLVLLIMFLVTIPLQTHAVKVGLSGSERPRADLLDPVKNKVTVLPSRHILWNGTSISMAELHKYLDISVSMDPKPELHLQPHPDAPYEVVDEVLAATKRANVTRMGFVGNEAYASF